MAQNQEGNPAGFEYYPLLLCHLLLGLTCWSELCSPIQIQIQVLSSTFLTIGEAHWDLSKSHHALQHLWKPSNSVPLPSPDPLLSCNLISVLAEGFCLSATVMSFLGSSLSWVPALPLDPGLQSVGPSHLTHVQLKL